MCITSIIVINICTIMYQTFQKKRGIQLNVQALSTAFTRACFPGMWFKLTKHTISR